MKKNLIILIILTIITSVVVYMVINREGATTLTEAQKNFAVEDTSAITRIRISDRAGNKVTLTRENGNIWKVNGKYTARKDAIKLLLKTIHDVRFLMPVSQKRKESLIKQMATQNTKAEIYAGDKLIKSYYIGGTTQDQLGTYMLLEDVKSGEKAPSPVITHIPGFNGYISSRYFISEKEWRDRTVFDYPPVEIASVEIIYPLDSAGSFRIEKNKEGDPMLFSPVTGENIPTFDTTEVMALLHAFRNLSYEGVVDKIPQEKIDSIISTVPMSIITVTETGGRKNTMKVFLKKAPPEQLDPSGNTTEYDLERAYALINEDQDFVLIQYFVFDRIFAIMPDFVR